MPLSRGNTTVFSTTSRTSSGEAIAPSTEKVSRTASKLTSDTPGSPSRAFLTRWTQRLWQSSPSTMTEVAGDPRFIRVNGFNDTWASGFTPIFLSDGISLPTSALVYIPL